MSGLVMVVDDDDDLREAICDALETAGYATLALRDADKALAELRRGLHPSLVLVDLMMPGLSGWDFREALRQDVRLAAVPLVLVTALRDPRARTLGAEVLAKPFHTEALLDLVRRHIGGATRGAPPLEG